MATASSALCREVPSILRRVAALPYEGLILLALGLIATFPVAGLKGLTLSGLPHLVLQVYLFAVLTTYFTWLWCHGGQTLAMKTWRFRVVARNGEALRFRKAFARLALAMVFYGPACAGIVLLFFPKRMSFFVTMWCFLPMIATIWWARFDSDRQFLHDRLARTRLVSVD